MVPSVFLCSFLWNYWALWNRILKPMSVFRFISISVCLTHHCHIVESYAKERDHRMGRPVYPGSCQGQFYLTFFSSYIFKFSASPTKISTVSSRIYPFFSISSATISNLIRLPDLSPVQTPASRIDYIYYK